LGKKRFLKLLKKNIDKMGEIVTVGFICCGIVLFGLALGFVFLQVQENA